MHYSELTAHGSFLPGKTSPPSSKITFAKEKHNGHKFIHIYIHHKLINV